MSGDSCDNQTYSSLIRHPWLGSFQPASSSGLVAIATIWAGADSDYDKCQ